MNDRWKKGLMVLLAVLPLIAFMYLAGRMADSGQVGSAVAKWRAMAVGALGGVMPQGEAGLAEGGKTTAIEKAYSLLVKDFDKELGANEMRVRQSPNKLNIELVEKVLFHSGSAEITPQGKQLLGRLDAVLKSAEGKHVYVIGHTDDVPIASSTYPSNWELSTARASSVIRFLTESEKVPSALFYAMGRADQQPVGDNATEQGRAANRRVEIVIADIPDLAPST
jgi:chemotaxis protein MotB